MTDNLPPLPAHWVPLGFIGTNASFQRAAREYAEEYARAAIEASRAAVPAWMAVVTKNDANNYCRVLKALGIEDSNDDPVSIIDMQKSWEAEAQSHSERLQKHLSNVLEIARTWQPDYATKMDLDTLRYAEEQIAFAAPQQVAQPLAYTLGEWFDATTVDLMQAFFESRLPAIREAAKEHGYAIGLHGSMRRDLDLIAVPWRDDASDADTLAHAIAMAACGITRAGAYDWEQKPAGRVATCIPICWTHRHGVLSDGHIDLSVAPVAQAKPEQATQQWQPIETAPTGISLLARNALGYVGRAVFNGEKWEHIGRPTHWMPLPPPQNPKD